MFNAKKVCCDLVKWVQNWFEINGKGCKAVVGISGGKDSSVVAALLVKALGKENVVGVLMPCGEQHDINYARDLVSALNIQSYEINIKKMIDALWEEVGKSVKPSLVATTNAPPRVRMTVLYALSQSINGRVANTCNLSEDWVGYSTRYGDSVGDFSPLSNLTVTEVKELGRYLGLDEKFIVKPPIDGLSGKTDEDNLGFTYDELDNYIRYNILPPADKKEKIDALHKRNLFKLKLMDSFPYKPE